MVKIYKMDSSVIHDTQPNDGYVIDMVRASDYAELERQRDALVAELSVVEKIHTNAVFITDDDYDSCPESVRKVIGALAVMSIPTGEAALREIGAKAVEDCAKWWQADDGFSRISEMLRDYAQQLREGKVYDLVKASLDTEVCSSRYGLCE